MKCNIQQIKAFALLGCYKAQADIWLPMFQVNKLVHNHQYKLHNNLEEQRTQLHW